MRFLFVIPALIGAAIASNNAFSYPLGGEDFQAGSTVTVTWADPSGATVTLELLQGAADNLERVATIGSHVINQGAVDWVVPQDLPAGEYAFRITNDEKPDEVNYSGKFKIEGGKAASATTSGSASGSNGTQSASNNGTETASATTASSNATSAAPTSANVTSSSTHSVNSTTESSGSSSSSATGSSSHASTSATKTGASSSRSRTATATASSSHESSSDGAPYGAGIAGLLGVVAYALF